MLPKIYFSTFLLYFSTDSSYNISGCGLGVSTHLGGVLPVPEYNVTKTLFCCLIFIVVFVVFSVPTAATIFLGVVAGFLLVLVVFFLYLNKKLCFANCGGFPCIEAPVKKKQSAAEKLGKF